jgi:hypothetical protein
MRTSAQAQRAAERQFPVRIRVALPPDGFGRQLAIMHAWLDETCGAEGWATAPAGLGGIVNDAVAFYFADSGFAHAFVARFCCGWRIETVRGAFAVRGEPPAPRRAAPPHRTP